MTAVARTAALAAALLFAGVSGASAHPHVFVTAKGVLVYGPNGTLREIRYTWAFDEMFSSFAAQGLDKNGDGKLSRDELQDLAKENVDSLKEFAYFTNPPRGGKQLEFGDPIDYWMDADDKLNLTLHFTLPVKNAPKGGVDFEVYDPTYFVAFSLANDKPISLAGAPAGCKVDAKGPDETPQTQNYSETFFTQLQAGAGFGAQFANHVAVRCP